MKSVIIEKINDVMTISAGRIPRDRNQRAPSDRATAIAWGGVTQVMLGTRERPQKAMGRKICVLCPLVIYF